MDKGSSIMCNASTLVASLILLSALDNDSDPEHAKAARSTSSPLGARSSAETKQPMMISLVLSVSHEARSCTSKSDCRFD